MTKKEQIIEMLIAQNPHLAAQRSLIQHELGKIMKQVGAVKGEDGYSPKKGQDYFTEEEKQAMAADIQSRIRIPQETADLIESVTARILANIRVPRDGRDGRDAKDGKTPVYGVDYMNDDDVHHIVGKVKPLIRDGKDGNHVDEVRLRDSILSAIPQPPSELDVVNTILKHPVLRVLLHGGGGSSSSSTTFYTQTPTGLVNGANTTYTTTSAITTVISLVINGEVIHPSEYTVAGAGFTMLTALPASLSGKGFTIVYV